MHLIGILETQPDQFPFSWKWCWSSV